jgi:hypothetical protein
VTFRASAALNRVIYADYKLSLLPLRRVANSVTSMPMPRLLKRLSEKSLRRRSQSSGDQPTPSRSMSEPVPPLPTPKSPQSYDSFQLMTPPTTLKTLSSPSTPLPLPNGGEIAETTEVNGNAPNLPTPLSGTDGAPDDRSKELAAAWDVANKDVKKSKTDKVIQQMGSSLPLGPNYALLCNIATEGEALAAQGLQSNATVVMTGITTVLDATGGMQAIEQGMNHFLEGSAVLMNVLDDVAKLHPFIGGECKHTVISSSCPHVVQCDQWQSWLSRLELANSFNLQC